MRYAKLGYAIEVEIKKDYAVRANILRVENNTYDVTLELKNSNNGKYDTLDEEHYSLTSENINMDVANLIIGKYNEGFFEHFIERYENEINMLERGIEIIEQERLGD